MKYHSRQSETWISRFYFGKKRGKKKPTRTSIRLQVTIFLTSRCLSVIQPFHSPVCSQDLNCHFLVPWVVRIMRGILPLCFISGLPPFWGCGLCSAPWKILSHRRLSVCGSDAPPACALIITAAGRKGRKRISNLSVNVRASSGHGAGTFCFWNRNRRNECSGLDTKSLFTRSFLPCTSSQSQCGLRKISGFLIFEKITKIKNSPLKRVNKDFLPPS